MLPASFCSLLIFFPLGFSSNIGRNEYERYRGLIGNEQSQEEAHMCEDDIQDSTYLLQPELYTSYTGFSHGENRVEEKPHGWVDWERYGPIEPYVPTEPFRTSGIGSSGYQWKPNLYDPRIRRSETIDQAEYDTFQMNQSFGSGFNLHDRSTTDEWAGTNSYQSFDQAEPSRSLDLHSHTSDDNRDVEGGEILDDSQSEDGSEDDIEVQPKGAKKLSQWFVKQKAQHKLRKLLDRAWVKNGLNFDMDPRDLALAVTKIKVLLRDHDDIDGIGMTASNKVKEKQDEDYRQTYQLYAKKYNKKYKTVLAEVACNTNLITDEDKTQFILSAISKYQPRKYNERLLFDTQSRKADMAADYRAREIWTAFMAHLTKKWKRDTTKMTPSELTIATIEKETRELTLLHYSPLAVQESIKRYLIRYFKKNFGDIERYCILRRQYQNKCHTEQKQKNNIERRKELGLRPPLRRYKAPQK